MANDIDVGTIIEEIVEMPVPQPITVTSASIGWDRTGRTTVKSGYTLWQTIFIVLGDLILENMSSAMGGQETIKWYSSISYNAQTGEITGLPYKSSFAQMGYTGSGIVFYIDSASVGGGS